LAVPIEKKGVNFCVFLCITAATASTKPSDPSKASMKHLLGTGSSLFVLSAINFRVVAERR